MTAATDRCSAPRGLSAQPEADQSETKQLQTDFYITDMEITLHESLRVQTEYK